MYEPVDGVEIVWPRGKPRNTPACGFFKELCVPEKGDNLRMTSSYCSCFHIIIIHVYKKQKKHHQLLHNIRPYKTISVFWVTALNK